jgi:TonB family protein
MAISRIAFVLLAITLLAACARRGPEYSVGGNPAVPAAQAERSLIERLLRRQISPPLDKPLTAVSVQLPPYPDDLRRANITGDVAIRFKVASNGAVSDARVEGSPHPVLAGYVLASVLTWRFEPLTRNGQPAEVPLHYVFRFLLR